jgi:hypothetical protein
MTTLSRRSERCPRSRPGWRGAGRLGWGVGWLGIFAAVPRVLMSEMAFSVSVIVSSTSRDPIGGRLRPESQQTNRRDRFTPQGDTISKSLRRGGTRGQWWQQGQCSSQAPSRSKWGQYSNGLRMITKATEEQGPMLTRRPTAVESSAVRDASVRGTRLLPVQCVGRVDAARKERHRVRNDTAERAGMQLGAK